MRGDPVEPPFGCSSNLDDLGGALRQKNRKGGCLMGWTLMAEGSEYLDGIRSEYTVSKGDYPPVAYAFDEGEARLIAAAPDMLAALEGAAAALFRLDGHDKEMFAGEIEAVRAAIAKATGQ